MVGHGFAELFFLGLQLRALCVSGGVYGRVRVWQFSGQWRGSTGVLGRVVSIGGEDWSRRNELETPARVLRKERRGAGSRTAPDRERGVGGRRGGVRGG